MLQVHPRQRPPFHYDHPWWSLNCWKSPTASCKNFQQPAIALSRPNKTGHGRNPSGPVLLFQGSITSTLIHNKAWFTNNLLFQGREGDSKLLETCAHWLRVQLNVFDAEKWTPQNSVWNMVWNSSHIKFEIYYCPSRFDRSPMYVPNLLLGIEFWLILRFCRDIWRVCWFCRFYGRTGLARNLQTFARSSFTVLFQREGDSFLVFRTVGVRIVKRSRKRRSRPTENTRKGRSFLQYAGWSFFSIFRRPRSPFPRPMDKLQRCGGSVHAGSLVGGLGGMGGNGRSLAAL